MDRITYWVVRNQNGELWLCLDKPERHLNGWKANRCIHIDDIFPSLSWEHKPMEIEIKSTVAEQVILETTHGMTNKEMQEELAKYPDDAKVAVECCDVRRMTYCESDNSIRID